VNQSMLMFSLGPVQPFIEQARKTRDLWLGSFLLSKLMESAMANIEKQLDGRFVFPFDRKVAGQYANLPNKYIAIFADSLTATEAARRSTKQIYDYWDTLRSGVWNEIVQWCADKSTRVIWERQSNPEASFEIRWVVVEGDQGSYADWLNQTEDAFAARKLLHDFQQMEEPGEKSTISGIRQILSWSLHERESERIQARAFWETLARRTGHPEHKKSLSAKEISLDGSERLDAIDTIKRFATKSKSSDIGELPFPSTSSIATASFVEGLLSIEPDQNKLQAWRDATEQLEEIPIGATDAIEYLSTRPKEYKWILQRDGDCYFPATFTPQRLVKDYGVDKDKVSRIAFDGREALNKLFGITDERGLRRPIPYYAILKMDGDHMGKLLSGAGSQSEHEDISKALSYFTRDDVKEIVNNRYPGRLVYAGGDDVLAFAPLARNLPKKLKDQPDTIKTVVALADQLRQQYRERMQRDVTASMSIAIAHHYAPLSYVLRVLRLAERQLAKKRYGRNALVVSVIRRSGAQTQVGCRWEYKTLVDAQAQPMQLFSRFYDLFEEDILSPKCVYFLLEEAPVLVKLEQDAQIGEIRRVLLRQLNDKKKDERSDEMSHLASRLVHLAEALDREHDFTDRSTELEDDEPRYGLVEVLGWLLVMVFLTRKEED